MKIVAFIIFGLLLAVAQGKTNNKTSGYRQGKIVHGRNVSLGERPYQVYLDIYKNGSRSFCGGSILDRYWVLTAAHCVHGPLVHSIIIFAGTIDLYKPNSTHHVEKIVPHENYNPELHWRNDIALLRVAEPFDFSNPLIKPADLEEKRTIPDNTKAIVSGWGENHKGQASTTLKLALVYIANPEKCRMDIQNEGRDVYPNQLCANNPFEKTGHCSGDSGGPLTVKGKLVGIVSWSNKEYGCGSPLAYEVYVRVFEYLDWIKSTTGSDSNVRWERNLL